MLKSNENLQGGKNKKHSEMNLDDHVRELVGKHLSEKAAEDKMKQENVLMDISLEIPEAQRPGIVDYGIPSLCL